jgi:hypothetical protein
LLGTGVACGQLQELGGFYTKGLGQPSDDLQAGVEGALLKLAQIASAHFRLVGEKKLDDLAARGRDAKRQTVEELASLRGDIDLYIDILEKSIEAQFDMARRQEIRRLLTTARAKRTRISNVINRRAANDG